MFGVRIHEHSHRSPPPSGINSSITCISTIRRRRRSGCPSVHRSSLGGFRAAKVSRKLRVRSLVSAATSFRCSSKPYPLRNSSLAKKRCRAAITPLGPSAPSTYKRSQHVWSRILSTRWLCMSLKLLWMKSLTPAEPHESTSWFGRMGLLILSSTTSGKLSSLRLEQPTHTSKIFVDHVLHALNCHFVCSYGGVTTSAPDYRGGLSPLQMQRATEFLEAHLDGNITLRHVAEACELSVSHFARAFKQTFHKPPYKWLTELRVDRATDLMTNSRLPLADIAIQCGFGGSICTQPLLQTNSRGDPRDMAPEDGSRQQRLKQLKRRRRWSIGDAGLYQTLRSGPPNALSTGT